MSRKENADFDPTLDTTWSFSRHGHETIRKRIVQENNCVFLADSGGKIIGYISGGLEDPPKWQLKGLCASIANFIVLEEYRGQQIGTRLMNSFLEWCRENKVGYVDVHVYAQNNRAIKFYKQSGFGDNSVILERKL